MQAVDHQTITNTLLMSKLHCLHAKHSMDVAPTQLHTAQEQHLCLGQPSPRGSEQALAPGSHPIRCHCSTRQYVQHEYHACAQETATTAGFLAAGNVYSTRRPQIPRTAYTYALRAAWAHSYHKYPIHKQLIQRVRHNGLDVPCMQLRRAWAPPQKDQE
ncbi:hypothetical protein M513_12350 [Trichuris suis]|uniref:Uncharacterized protein n=1 Tax=Trichuris suis TaxID=68888 RepID=A0A085LP73_9BILA|nr:hypothetical protein M513_12350 [Trichuris suis]